MGNLFVIIAFGVFVYGILKGLKWSLKKVDKVDKLPHLKRAAAYTVGGFCAYIALAMAFPKEKIEETTTTPAPATTKAEQHVDQPKPDTTVIKANAFKSWKNDYDAAMAMFDLAWINWRGTMDRLSKGSIDQHTAWQNMKTLNSDLNVVKSMFDGLKAPDILEDDAKTLNNAATDIADTCSARARAAKMMMEMLDNNSFKPSKLDAVMSEIQSGDTVLISAAKKVMVVERLLGAQPKSKK